MGAMGTYYGNAAEIFGLFRTAFAKTGAANTEMTKDAAAAALTTAN